MGGTRAERHRLLDDGPHREEWEGEQTEKVGIHEVPMVCTVPSALNPETSWTFPTA